MNGDEMVQVTRFAVALGRMTRAAKGGEPVTLSADENAAMVATIRTLITDRKKSGDGS